MKSIEVHKNFTPTRDNSDAPFSLGILYLTDEEAERITEFARGIRKQAMRTDDERAAIERKYDGLNSTEDIQRRFEGVGANSAEDIKRRLAAVGANLESGNFSPQPTIPAEPPKPRNRFSGLDITDEPQA